MRLEYTLARDSILEITPTGQDQQCKNHYCFLTKSSHNFWTTIKGWVPYMYMYQHCTLSTCTVHENTHLHVHEHVQTL